MKHNFNHGGEGNDTAPITASIRVWDLPVRVFHWLLALSFTGAYLTAEMDDWRLVHVTLGYTLAGLVGFRIIWGVVGTDSARFSRFVRGPQTTLRYLRSMIDGRPQHFTGHNPAGAMAIVLMLVIALFLASSGWLLYTERAGEWMEEVHELIANLMLAVVLLHVAGVIVASLLHRENLAKAMVTGYKQATSGTPAQSLRAGTALLLLIAVLGFWWWQGSAAEAPASDSTGSTAQHQPKHDD